MFRRLFSTYPKNPQSKVLARLENPEYRVWGHRNVEKHPVWGEVTKKDTGLDTTEYGFKREIVPSDLKPKEKIWHGWIP